MSSLKLDFEERMRRLERNRLIFSGFVILAGFLLAFYLGVQVGKSLCSAAILGMEVQS
jgi:hypothetical protein